MTFTSNKVFNLGSAAFRQWKATHSHCRYIHGYNLTADITFETDKLDGRNWVADFGGFKELKTMFEHTFDHKLVVAGDDPELELFKKLDDAGVAELVILPAGVGCERFAEFVLKTADKFIDLSTEGRVRVKSVQINEHEKNFATCYRQEDVVNSFTSSFTHTESDNTAGQLTDIHGPIATFEAEADTYEPDFDPKCTSEVSNVTDSIDVLVDMSETPAPPEPIANAKAAPVGKVTTKTKGGWFDGTTWG